MGLCAFDQPDRPSIIRGIDYLVRMQNQDGSWTEHETTGTGFPKVFYFKYDMYRNSWPLLALSVYRKMLVQSNGAPDPSSNGESERGAKLFAAATQPRVESEFLHK
jgi:squalene-hopene/tetraprenyl-beta-curcumene cyclase